MYTGNDPAPRRLPSALSSRDGWADLLELKRPADPHVHQIEPTNHCPYRCVMCPRSRLMTRDLGFMDMGLYRAIIDEIATFDEAVRAKEIELFHFGESLLHPDIHGMVRYAAQQRLNTVLSVNAPELLPAVAERILAEGPARLIVSLDGYDEASYRRIRGAAADFATATANLRHLTALVRRNSPPTQVCIRMIRMTLNESHLERFCEEWEGSGISVEIRPFFPWTEKELAGLGEVRKYPPYMPCPFPWQYLVVQWDGTVVPCCRDYNGVNAVGNVREQSLREIWNGERYAAFRRQHRSGDYDGNIFCRDCMEIFYTDGDATP
jgi:radical SAM protein with 4Fe4S-binding SPASM domain